MLRETHWLFLYYIDKTTYEFTDATGQRMGQVLYGRPCLDSDAASTLGCSTFTVSRWRNALASLGYIHQKWTGRGWVVLVNKSKKWDWSDTANPSSSESLSKQNCSVRPSRTADSDLAELLTQKMQPQEQPTHNQADGGEVFPPTEQLHNNTNQPTSESGESECDDLVGRLVGWLVSLYREKTGERFNSNKEQRRGVGELASAYGAQDVIATFEEWLKRPRGTGGLEWPLAQFIGEYAGYSPARQAIREAGEREAKARRLAGVRCPACHGSELLQSGTWRKCVACDRTFDAADCAGGPALESDGFGRPRGVGGPS
jgi:hypothetical protein